MSEENSGMRSNWIERYTIPLLWIVALLSFTAFAYRIWNQEDLRPKAESIYLLQAIVLLATAIVLIFYTYETYKLREAAQKQIEVGQKQIEIQQRPFVIFETGDFKDEQGMDRSYRVRNIGTSTAVNVFIMDIYPEDSDSYYWIRSYTHSQGRFISSLMPQEASYLDPRRRFKDENISRKNPHIEGLIDCSFSVKVLFSNVDMQDYYVSQHISPTHMVILDSGPCESQLINLDPP
jgi:hypothetical protein